MRPGRVEQHHVKRCRSAGLRADVAQYQGRPAGGGIEAPVGHALPFHQRGVVALDVAGLDLAHRADGASADGSIAVGLLWNECSGVAFRWTSAGGLTPLELLGASFRGVTMLDGPADPSQLGQPGGRMVAA